MARKWSLASMATMMLAPTAGVIVMAVLLATCAPPGSTVPISWSHWDSGKARSAASMPSSGSNAPARSRQLATKSPASASAEDVNLARQKLEKLPASALVGDLNLPRQKLEKSPASALAEDLNLPRQKLE